MSEPEKDKLPEPQDTGQEPGDRGATTAAQDKEAEKAGDDDSDD